MSFAANADAQRRKQCAVFHSKKSGFVPSAASVTLTSVRDVNNGWVTLAAMTIRHEEEAQDEVARRLVAYAERLRREANESNHSDAPTSARRPQELRLRAQQSADS